MPLADRTVSWPRHTLPEASSKKARVCANLSKMQQLFPAWPSVILPLLETAQDAKPKALSLCLL